MAHEVLTSDNMRKVVEEEGLEARNLLNWNVIVSDTTSTLEVPKMQRKPPPSPRPQSASPRPPMVPKDTESQIRRTNRCSSLGRPKTRLRSSSAGRNPEKCVRARYWAFLFENLYRAVDEIYQTCEVDESIVESKEAIMMLENYCKEFKALIQWLTISKNYEVTAARNRPTSLAWEVRKSLPTKGLLRNIFLDKLGASSGAKRKLDFHGNVTVQSTAAQTDSATDSPPKTLQVGNVIEMANLQSECVAFEALCPDAAELGTKVLDGDSTKTAPINMAVEVINLDTDDCSNKGIGEGILESKGNEAIEKCEESAPVSPEDTGSLLISDKDNCCVSDLKESPNDFENTSFAVKFLGRDELMDAPCSKAENSERAEIPCAAENNADKEKDLVTHSEANENVTSNTDSLMANNSVCQTLSDHKTSESMNMSCENGKDIESPPTVVKISESSQTEGLSKPVAAAKVVPQNRMARSKGPNTVPLSKAPKLFSVTANNSSKCTVTKSAPLPHVASKYRTTSSNKAELPFVNKGKASVIEKPVIKTGTSNAKRTPYSSLRCVQASQKYAEQRSVPAASQRLRPSQHYLGKDIQNGATFKPQTNTCLNTDGKKLLKIDSRHVFEANKDDEEDSEGWETVRSRTRCKNSPAKKIQAQNGTFDKIVAANKVVLKQTKIGGFPYTCTSNAQIIPKKPSKAAEATLKKAQINGESNQSNVGVNPKSTIQASDKKPESKKLMKENIKPETTNKLSVSKSNQNGPKTSKSSTVVVCRFASSSTKRENSLKAATKTPGIERQLTMDVSSSQRLKKTANLNLNLRRTQSTSSFELQKRDKVLKKETAKTGAVKVSLPDCCISKKEQDSAAVDLSRRINSEEMNETLDVERNGSPTSMPEGKGEISLETHTTEDAGSPTVAEDSDEVSKDEDLTLKLYEAMIREEAQEHISELGLSWGDQMDLLDMELRTPGRALQMHEKLSSPFRKRTLAETIKRQEEKQLKAQEQRERLLEEKAQRSKDIQKKVEEMKALSEKKQEQQRISLEQRLLRAEEKRRKELEKIVKKAHDEEEKVNEIAFINSLEAQNKRHEIICKEKDHEARLQDIQGERQRKLEEKAAKEAAAEERRKVLEAERQARLLEMQEKRKQRDLKIEQQLLEKEKERQELANQKARERESRLNALNAAQQATVEELQKKIQLKQEESARRHEENIEQIRQKAFELSVRRYSSINDDVPKLVPYETKKICTVCNVLIGSEVYLLSHLRGKKHQEMISDQHQGQDPSTEELELYNLKHIVDATTDQLDPNIALDKERLKALKKRCKKIRQRMAVRGMDFEKTFNVDQVAVGSKNKQKIIKLCNEIRKYTAVKEKCALDANSVCILERTLTELDQLFSKCSADEKVDFRSAGGVGEFMDLVTKLVMPVANNNSSITSKVLVQMCKVAHIIFKDNHEDSLYVLLSNKLGLAIDALIQRLRVLIPDDFNKLVTSSYSTPGLLPVDEAAGEFMSFLSVVLEHLSKKKSNDAAFWDAAKHIVPENTDIELQLRITDIVSYIVSIGIVDRLSHYFSNIRGAVDSEPAVATFLYQSMSFLMSLVKLSSDNYTNVFQPKKSDDPTQLLATIKVTELVGAVSLLYCILLHGDSPTLGETPPPQLPTHTVLLTLAALRMLNHSAVFNLHVVQGILGSEGLSLQLRHITNYLLWYCNHWEIPDLLHEIILLIGYFTVLNPDNQLIIQAGQGPSVLKQLSMMPFQYFSNKQLTDVLFPTLISCCFHSDSNKSLLQHEMSIELLSHYVEGYLLDVYNSAKAQNDPNIRWRLYSRFPKCKWLAAKTYFAQPTDF